MVVVIRYRSRCPGLISLFLVCRPRVFKGGECILWHPTAAPGVAGVIYHEGGNSPWYTSYGTEIILDTVKINRYSRCYTGRFFLIYYQLYRIEVSLVDESSNLFSGLTVVVAQQSEQEEEARS